MYRNELTWYAIHSKPGRESLAFDTIRSLGIEAFLPRLRRGPSIRRIIKPLFPGYLFARFEAVSSLERVRYAQGILSVVCTGRFPLPIEDEIIEAIRAAADADGYVHLASTGLRPGDRVAIEHGPLQGLMGRVAREEDDRKRVTILLDSLLQARVSVDRDWLTSVAEAA